MGSSLIQPSFNVCAICKRGKDLQHMSAPAETAALMLTRAAIAEPDKHQTDAPRSKTMNMNMNKIVTSLILTAFGSLAFAGTSAPVVTPASKPVVAKVAKAPNPNASKASSKVHLEGKQASPVKAAHVTTGKPVINQKS